MDLEEENKLTTKLYRTWKRNKNRKYIPCNKYGFYKLIVEEEVIDYKSLCRWVSYDHNAIRRKIFRGIPLFLKNYLWYKLTFPDRFSEEKAYHSSVHKGQKLIESYPKLRGYLSSINFIEISKFIYQKYATKNKKVKTQTNNENILPSGDDLKKLYKELRHKICGYEYQIHVDIQRTHRDHYLFNESYGYGQRSLFYVLVAYANYVPSVGYCQGMSDFAAILLMYFSEIDAFEMLVTIIRRNGLEKLFDKKMSGIKDLIEAQKKVLSDTVPDIMRHIEKEIDVGVFVYNWHLTLFTRFDIEIVLRVWDVLMAYGAESLLYFTAAILRYNKNVIMKNQAETLIELLGNMENWVYDVEILMEYFEFFVDTSDLI